MAARSDGAFFPVTAQRQRKKRPVPDLERRLGRVTKSGPLRTSIPAFHQSDAQCAIQNRATCSKSFDDVRAQCCRSHRLACINRSLTTSEDWEKGDPIVFIQTHTPECSQSPRPSVWVRKVRKTRAASPSCRPRAQVRPTSIVGIGSFKLRCSSLWPSRDQGR